MSIRTSLTTLSLLALTINFASAQNYSGKISDRNVTATAYLSKISSASVSHERIGRGEDPHSIEDFKWSCQSRFALPLGTALVNFGHDKLNATLTAVAYLESTDDGECVNPKINESQTLDFNILISLDNEKAAVSYYDDHTGKTVNIYNNNTMYSQLSALVSLDKTSGEYNVISIASGEDSAVEVIKNTRGGASTKFTLNKLVLSGATYSKKAGDSRETLDDSIGLVLSRISTSKK